MSRCPSSRSPIARADAVKRRSPPALPRPLAGEGFDVGLLDADPNGGAHRWAITTYTGPKVASYAEPDKDRLADLLPVLADRHAVLIADTAGFGNLAATICMVGADAILIPVSPGEGDVVEARKTVSFTRGWPALPAAQSPPASCRTASGEARPSRDIHCLRSRRSHCPACRRP